MKLLIIGSEGFIGSNCFHFFSQKFPEWEIWGCDITGGSYPNYFQVSGNIPDYASIFRSRKFDICMNASGSGSVPFSIENPEKDYELNVKNVQRMLDAISKYNPACKFINFSSAAVYGNPAKLPVKESDELNPISPYGRHKLESEKILTQYHREYKIPTCSLRIFSAYGPRLKKQIFWDIYQKSLLSKEVRLFGTGDETRDFIYIDDLAYSVQCIIEKSEFIGEAVNIATGTQATIKETSERFASCLGPDINIIFTGEKHAGSPLYWQADISILESMGFHPHILLNEGLLHYSNWLKKYFNYL